MLTKNLYYFLFLVFITTIICLTGCERVQNVVIESIPEDIIVEAIPVKIVLFIDYPDSGKDAYLEWIASIAPTLGAPDEVNRIRSYDNQDQSMSPNRLVEFEFSSFIEAATYLNRPEIAEIMSELPNHTSNVTTLTFIQRSDYAKTDNTNLPIKGILLINYPLGGKQAYLDWVESVSSNLVGPSQLKAIASYDNYYGETPHRLVEFEFASQEDSTAYGELDEIKSIEVELDNRTSSWIQHVFELRSDYINE